MRGADSSGEDESRRMWPWGPRAAAVTTALLLVISLLGLAFLRTLAGWPDTPWEGWVLLGVVLISLLPILLLVLDRMAAQGGSLEALGVKVSFRAVAQARRATEVPANMGVPAGLALADAGGGRILEAMRSFADHDVAVVDLEDGTAWWETRLVVVCAGARRLGRPRVIAFLATRAGMQRTYVGWADPGKLLERLCQSNSAIRHAVDAAEVEARRWLLSYAPSLSQLPNNRPVVPAGIPFPDARTSGELWIAFQGDRRSSVAPETFLMQELSFLEQGDVRGVTVVRLHDLVDADLHTSTVDASASDSVRLAAVLRSEDEYVAVTRNGTFVGLLARTVVANQVLANLVTGPPDGR